MRSTRASARWSARGSLALSLVAAALAAAPPIEYPPAPRREVIADFHGTPVADPHRILEDAADPRTATWLAAEQELTASVLGALPRRAAIRRRLEELSQASSTEVPWREGGRLFYVATDGRAQQPVLYEEQVSGEARAVVDPNRISPDGAIAVGDFVVSPDARRVAFRMARGGEDLGEVRVWEVDSGRDLGESIPGVSNLGSWLPDARGFFYVRPATSAPEGARSGKQIVMHRLGRPASEDVVVHVFPGAAARWAYCMTSANGRWALFVAEKGSESELVVLELEGDRAAGPNSRRFTLLAGRGGFHTPLDFAGDTLFVRTNLDAPRGRVVALDLGAAADAAPRPVVAETPETLENAVIAGDRLVLHYLVDVESRLRLHALDGAPAGEIALPGPGAVGWPLSARPGSPELHYAFASYLAPSTVYRYDVRTRTSTPFRAPRVPFDADAYETRQVFVASPDGTRVPMFVTAAKGLARRGERPAFLTAYGGYGASLQPAYDPEIPLWLEMGGVYAVANLRGGGEYGEAWHRGGHARAQAVELRRFLRRRTVSRLRGLYRARAAGDLRSLERRSPDRRGDHPAAATVRRRGGERRALRHAALPPLQRRRRLGLRVRLARRSGGFPLAARLLAAAQRQDRRLLPGDPATRRRPRRPRGAGAFLQVRRRAPAGAGLRPAGAAARRQGREPQLRLARRVPRRARRHVGLHRRAHRREPRRAVAAMV